MVFQLAEKKLYRDFLSYYKHCDSDDYYIVSINNPKVLQYLEEFLDRRNN